MPVARPKGVALTRSIASSSVSNGTMHITGPKTSWQPTCIASSTSASSVGGTTAPVRAPPARRRAPPRHRLVDPALDALRLRLADHRADHGLRHPAGRRTAAPRPSRVSRCSHRARCDALHQQDLDRRAHLARLAVAGVRRSSAARARGPRRRTAMREGDASPAPSACGAGPRAAGSRGRPRCCR